ncbi:MAG: VOC family protein [Candidatus Binatia bacterium]
MTRVHHLAIAAKNPGELADFYRRAMDLQILRENDSATVLSDGAIELVLLSGRNPGLDHIGFQVEQADTLRQIFDKSLTKAACRVGLDGEPCTEFRVTDPDGNAVHFFAEGSPPAKNQSPFPIRHIALYTPDPQRLAEFYGGLFQMRKVSDTDRASIFVSDGYLNLALLSQRPEEGLGLHHFGFHVRNIRETQQRLVEEGVGAGDQRPSRIPYAEYRILDPEGNGFDISQKGWKA